MVLTTLLKSIYEVNEIDTIEFKLLYNVSLEEEWHKTKNWNLTVWVAEVC